MSKYYLTEKAGRCLGCGCRIPDPFLDLGQMPLANDYVDPRGKPQRRHSYKLRVAYCPECHLVQIIDIVDPRELFTNYLYFSSTSNAFVDHSAEMARTLTDRLGLGAQSLVMEIASNDGYLLQFFKQMGIPVIGIEPAKNIAKVASDRGIPTLAVFFGPDTVDLIVAKTGQADVIIGNNVLAHVPAINDFLASVNRCLKPGGSAAFEFPYLKDLIEHVEFDTIYHEHVFYYSLSAINILASRAGLTLFDAQKVDVHGGSLRIFLGKSTQHSVSSNVATMLAEEKRYGLTAGALYDQFGKRVQELRNNLLECLQKLKNEGNTIAAYGAAAKGNTLLNYAGIGKGTIDFVVDKSVHKQGLLLPGTGIPIMHPDELLRRKPDYSLILAWNFAKEIIKEQEKYLAQGGKFIIPIPELRIVGGNQ